MLKKIGSILLVLLLIPASRAFSQQYSSKTLELKTESYELDVTVGSENETDG